MSTAMTETIEYYTLESSDGNRSGLLRRTLDAEGLSDYECVSGGQWVGASFAFKYFNGTGGDQLEPILLTDEEARDLAASRGVTL